MFRIHVGILEKMLSGRAVPEMITYILSGHIQSFCILQQRVLIPRIKSRKTTMNKSRRGNLELTISRFMSKRDQYF